MTSGEAGSNLSPRSRGNGDHPREGLTGPDRGSVPTHDPQDTTQTGVPVTRDADRDTVVTPPEGGRDTEGPGHVWCAPGEDPQDIYVPPVVSFSRHRELEADRDRWRTAWDEERRARVIAEQAGSTGLADAARLRMALNVALDELRSEGRPAAKAIADASGTMANALEGRPLAAARNDEDGPSWTNGDGGPQAVVDMALTQLRVTPGARAFIVARRRHDLRWLYTLLCQSAPESYRAREGYRDLRTPEGGSIAVVDPTAFAERPEGIYVYRQVSS